MVQQVKYQRRRPLQIVNPDNHGTIPAQAPEPLDSEREQRLTSLIGSYVIEV